MSESERSRGARRPMRRRLRRALFAGGGIAAAGVLAFVGTGIASALTAGSGYRTAPVERAAVSESVQTSGTVAAVSRYDLAFQTDGTVATVEVALGDTVRAGQTLATLDRDALEDAVAEAEEVLRSAEQTLAEHAEAQVSGTTAETSSVAGTPAAMLPVAAVAAVVQQGVATLIGATAADGSTAAGTADVEAAVQRVTAAQQAMLAKHGEVQALLEATNSTVAAADDACAPFLGALLSDPEGNDAGTEAGVEAGMTLEQAQQALADCQSAITVVRDGQAGVGAGQQEVQDLATALDAAVAELQRVLADAGSGPDTGGSGTGGAGTGGESPGDAGAGTGAGLGEGTALPGAGSVPEAGSTGGGTGGGSGAASAGTTITAEQLLADQAAIDAAEARLRIAEAQLAFSALTSPIDGAVAAVDIAEGDSVEAGSAAVTVIGEDGYVVETTISLSDIAKLAVGQEAEAVVNASGETYPGAVSSIGLLDVSSTSTPAYTVIVALKTGDDELLVGGSARLSIRTAATEDALTVPTSAVHRNGATATVNVLDGDEPTAVEVELGAVGSERTEILTGLEEGQSVVLADLSLEISGDDDSGAGGLAGLGGSGDERSLPGGGFPGGGFQPPAGGFGG